MDQEPRRIATLITGFTMLLLTIALIVFSEHGFHATVDALKLFFEVVFPSLLPFFILSDVLLSTGMVHYLGVYFEPLMRPLFNVPGVGSFVFSMGLAAGYPMDAVLTAKFRRQNLCTKVEGERLLAFSNSADPLFLFGAVAVGMFGQPALGAVLAMAHYASVLMVGLTFRFYGRRADHPRQEEGVVLRGIHKRAMDALIRGRMEDGRSYGKVFNQAIGESMGTLFMIMSFMVLFAVLLRVLTATGLMVVLTAPLTAVFHVLGFSPQLVPAAVKGLFEIDLGSAAAAHASAPLLQKLVIVSAIVAWSGLSVHGQVASVLADTDISMKPYFMARALHAVYAGIMTVVFFHPVEQALGGITLPAFADRDFLVVAPTAPTMVDAFHVTLLMMILSLSALAVAMLVMGIVRMLRLEWLGARFR
ncbi:MAG: sporulation integral membrane protein YlbJ [Sulfobacillus thermosulfidooxidans]|uniref:sporulation integral membrane protein YlbJ n=1 Tax=Sulfobacillus TaxID=28033 RepID=UPI000CD29849|nr:sporulation integral membrane protein YlbJ [Sulfobacillus sp. hq2]POB10278.1 sporulation integral membrane protein YlbJ [Sulfobacillus sp. hq2]PSR35663.1 MAG: sporulation integral membrane protein YlbJ [Sulfobacillus thermosulfidooxidans]